MAYGDKAIEIDPEVKAILEADDVKIVAKHAGMLEIPDDKKFWELPFKHFTDLVERKGYARIIRALTNLEVWNRKDNPDISKKASDLADKLKEKFRPEK